MATVISGFLCHKKELFNVRNQVQANILKAPHFEWNVECEMKHKEFHVQDLLFYMRVLDVGSKYYCDIVCESLANGFRLPPDKFIFDGITTIEKINYHSGGQDTIKKMEHLAQRLDNLIAEKKFYLVVIFSHNIWWQHQQQQRMNAKK